MAAEQMQMVKMADLLDAGKRFLRFGKQHSFKGVLVIIVCMLLASGYFFIQKPAYTASVTFILEEKSGGMGGSLSSLASQFGFDFGSMGGNPGMFAGDNILDILKSRSIVEKVLLTKIDSAAGAHSATLADLFIDFSGLKKKWKDGTPAVAGISFAAPAVAAKRSTVQDSVLYVLYERLFKKHISAERLNKKGSIIVVRAVSANQVFSKLFSERLLDETRELYISVKTGISAASVARLEARADSLLRIMNAKSYQSASQQLLDANAAFKTAVVPAEVSQRDRMVTYAIYTEVMKSLEASRMAVASQTPVIQLLDAPKYPLDDKKKSLMMLLLLGFAGGLGICGVLAFFFYPGKGSE